VTSPHTRRTRAGSAAAAVAGLALVAGCAVPRPPQGEPHYAPPAPASTPAPSASATAAAAGGEVAGFDDVERATVRVRNVECGTGIATGSGFAVDAHTLITNHHVVKGARTLQVDTYDGQELSVTATGVSTFADLAVVRTRQTLPAHVPLALADPATGAPVRVVGFPLGGQMTTSAGTVLGMVTDPLATMREQVLATDAKVEPGSSGSAVLDAAGNVVGVIYAGQTDGKQSFAIPVSTLAKVLSAPASTATPSC
jgi:S1-C subfamily serine protease